MEIEVQILRAESRKYKDSKTQEEKYFNQLQVLQDGELIDVSCSKDIAEYVLKNLDSLKSKKVTLQVKAKGFEVLSILK